MGAFRTSKRAGLIAAAFLLAVSASLLLADDDKEKEKIKVTVVAVLASSEHNRIDKRLLDLVPELKKKDASWTGFEVERSCAESMKIGEQHEFTLVDDFKVTITLKGRTEKGGVRVGLQSQSIEDFGYTCCCGKYFALDTQFNTKEKKRLVVAIMVEPCSKKK